MPTRRQSIRDRIRELILDESAITEVDEKKVFTNRYQTLDAEKLPVVVIRTLSESAQLMATAPIQQYRRTMATGIDIVYKADLDKNLDDLSEILAQKIETVLLLNYLDSSNAAPKWNYLDYKGYDPDMMIEGDGTISVGRLNFNVVYDTEAEVDDLVLVEGIDSEIKGNVKYGEYLDFDISFNQAQTLNEPE